ncbi:putative monosaccharide-P-dolichol utilization protein [Aspergillus brunneoviolaceus CBS 621.78]|uniref:Mannose-P-dolichol utilization defect 1 protein homolog n=2 Tax=Aspergillus TaxID=5052 RepID=A0A8G1RLU1_9EURO|nr:mannose-P-dolichol utilization defect 1 protein [Aspergillus brunneoviolaceus CBS 621.78]XP_040799660.1 mannose-P-dolichol utilization defect 1 protein [Aspergillus fijiensis CBS 313.89]RAH51391.1 mannose-P-dolichol utilization defect 1 protein [Aspergillus brunneoviolaceus CBS 621.78]RAK75650.1 mannose-P-dolichol utilization defect 1 protein [Aspergillus fijiensis CBS 313.89]
MDLLQKSVLDPLQPVLRPIVSAVPEPVHDAIISLIGQSCHNALVVDLDISKDPACTSLAISKALGIAIVGASAIVKVPQILKLINSRSSAGVSFVSYALETASLLITLSYSVRNNFPFSTFGESALIAVQDVVVGVLVLVFAGRSAAAAAFVAVVAASVYTLLFDQTLVDAKTMSLLQAGAGALGVASKAPQIFTIWSEGGTGQLSAFAVFNYLAGSLSRIFTTLQEVDDKLILYGFIAGFSLNLILAAQMLYYWNSPAKSQVKKQTKGKPIASASAAGVATPKPTATSSGISSPKPSGKTPTTRRRG